MESHFPFYIGKQLSKSLHAGIKVQTLNIHSFTKKNDFLDYSNKTKTKTKKSLKDAFNHCQYYFKETLIIFFFKGKETLIIKSAFNHSRHLL